MTLASELEMRPLVAHCHLGPAGSTGARVIPSRPGAPTTATAMSSAMGMTYWLQKLEKGN